MTDNSAAIVVDTYSEDDNYSQSTASDIHSLRSSIVDYVYENGRRYHAYHAGTYWGSNDEKSMDAMDVMYVI